MIASTRPLRGARSRLLAAGWLAWLAASGALGRAGEPPDQREKQRAGLRQWQAFIGEWRGVGQPQRGSTKDAWTEECGWSWSFTDRGVALALRCPEGRFLRSARLAATAEAGQFQLTATTENDVELNYQGGPTSDGHLQLVADKVVEGHPARITIRLVAGGDRMLVLYERPAGQGRYARMAEVGLTRKGSNFGRGSSSVECVLTGGLGTIPVQYGGQTYYVCCTGCRDYFQDHPEEVLAEYRARKEAARKEKPKP
jgi:hypothetical protein